MFKSVFGITILIFLSVVSYWILFLPREYSYNLGEFSKPIISENGSVEHEVTTPDSIYFLGDIMLGRAVERILKKEGGTSYSFLDFSINNINSFAVGNFEASIPEVHQPTPDFGFRFSVDKNLIPDLRKAGITHLSLANNHSNDFGIEGFRKTESVLIENDIIPFGTSGNIATSSVSYIEIYGLRVAILGLMALDKFWTAEELFATVATMNENSDYKIVFIHWGPEYQENQSVSQEIQAKVFSSLGIDLVIGHHPHVVQGIDLIENTLVVYSLGNFIFDQYFSDSVQQGLVVKLNYHQGLVLDLIPVSSLGSRARPKILSGETKDKFLEDLAERSNLIMSEEIISGQINLLDKLATSSKEAIISR